MRFQSICDGAVCQNKARVWQPGKKRETFPIPAALTLPPLCPKVVGSRPLSVYYTGKPVRDDGVQRQRKKKNTISFCQNIWNLLTSWHHIFPFWKIFKNYWLSWNALLLLFHVYLYRWDLNIMICSVFHMTALDKWSQDFPCDFLLKIKHASPSLPCLNLFVCYCLYVYYYLIGTTLWPLAWEVSLLLPFSMC